MWYYPICVWYYPNVCDTTQCVWYYPNVCDTTKYVCDTIPMCVILPNMCVILFQCVWYYPMVWYSPVVLGPAPRSTLSAIVSDFQRSQSSHHPQSLSIRRVKWCHLRFAFVLLFQNRAWLVVDHQNVQKYKECQFATYASKLNAPLHYCSYMSDDNC